MFVPYNESAASLLKKLAGFNVTAGLLRQLQPYGVTVYADQREELKRRGLLREKDGICWLDVSGAQKKAVYTEESGLCIEADTPFLCC